LGVFTKILQTIPYTYEYILQYVVGVFMLYHHPPDMPIQFLLIFFYDGGESPLFVLRIPELQKQLGVLDGH
jgi:hypothetical protein